jgi:hypothetical protein
VRSTKDSVSLRVEGEKGAGVKGLDDIDLRRINPNALDINASPMSFTAGESYRLRRFVGLAPAKPAPGQPAAARIQIPITSSALPPPPMLSDNAKRLQGTLQRYGCYQGKVDGLWGTESEQVLTRFARENGDELESLGPTIDNIIKVEGGVSAGCASVGSTAAVKIPEMGKGCVPIYGAKVFSAPDRSKVHPDWTGETKIGTWGLADTQIIANSTDRYVYGKLYSPRGGYQKWVYGLAEEWTCR